jgi:hypothetical protein
MRASFSLIVISCSGSFIDMATVYIQDPKNASISLFVLTESVTLRNEVSTAGASFRRVTFFESRK